MVEADLPTIAAWLLQPHVAQWWTTATTPDDVIEGYRLRTRGHDPRTHMLMAAEERVDVGWCQWYAWSDYPDESLALGAREGEIGLDYAVGDPLFVGRGLGTRLVEALIDLTQRIHPGAPYLVEPAAGNVASRRVLEKNGFVLSEVRTNRSTSDETPRALYRR